MPVGEDVVLARAVEAFLEEHRRCWLLYGEGIEGGDDDEVVLLICSCGARLVHRLEAR
jgi:hypothetical protein